MSPVRLFMIFKRTVAEITRREGLKPIHSYRISTA